jgi:hypothetical protein
MPHRVWSFHAIAMVRRRWPFNMSEALARAEQPGEIGS